MSVLGAISQKDKGTGVLPNLEAPPETTGFFQNIHAGFQQAVAGPHSTQNARAIYESRNYDQIIQALKAEGEKATDYIDSPVDSTSPFYRHVEGEQILPDGRVRIPVKRDFTNPFSEGPSLTRDVNPLANLYLGGDSAEIKQIFDAVNRVRARKGLGFLKEFPDPTAIDATALKQRQADEATAGAVTSRATTLGKVGAFIGGIGGSIASGDPENLVGGASGAAGKTFARTVVKRAVEGAVANTAAGTVALPGQEADTERMGQAPMTAGEMAHSVAQNAAAGALLGGTHAIIPHVPGAVGAVVGKTVDAVAPHLPDTVRDPVVAASIRAGTVKDRQLLTEFQRLHNPYSVVDSSTPTEKAAAHVMVSDIETKEQSPLQPAAEGAHADRLTAVAKALGVDLTPPDMPTTAPTQVPTVRDQTAGSAGRRPASFVEGINAAEGSTRNPRSSADGYGNFIDKTWLAVAPHVTDTAGMSRDQILALRHDKGVASAATNYYAAQNGSYLRTRGLEDSPGNLSLAHFLGPEGAAELLKADPSTPVESILPAKVIEANHEVLRGKSADQVIAWAHKRIGAAVDHPPARPDAVPDEGFNYSSPVRYSVESLKPDELPPTSAPAPTDAPWDPTVSQHLLVWESADGERSLIDGGKRLAHARSLYPEDQSIRLPTVVLREADGVSEEMAMLVGKLKNVNLGTTSLEEAAGTLADLPEIAGALRSPQFRQEIAAIAQLPHEDFGAVVRGEVVPHEAAIKAINERTQKLADQIRHYWSFQKEGGFRRKPVQVVVSPDGEIRTWAASSSESAVDRQFRDGDTITKLKPDDHATLNALLEKQNEPRPEATGGSPREPPSREGRNLPPQAADENLSRGIEPSLFDRAVAARDGAEKFSDPVSPEAKEQADILEHDLRQDAEAETLVGYHGTHAAFNRFALGHEGEGVSGAARNGFFFSSDFMDARGYAEGTAPGGRVITAHLGLERPLDLSHEDHGIDHVIKQDDEVAALIEAARAASADGLILRNVGGAGRHLYVAFDPEKIRVVGESAPDATSPNRELNKPVHLFDLPETGFRLSEEGNTVSIKEALDSADADEAAAKALRDCL